MNVYRKSSDGAGGSTPNDPHLRGLQALLDARRVRDTLQARIGPEMSGIESCEIAYVRYKPQTNCLVSYMLRTGGQKSEVTLYGKCYTDADFANAAGKAEAGNWIEIDGVQPVVIVPELSAIFYRFPNDKEIPGLRLIADPKKVQRILYDYLTELPAEQWRISDKRLQITLVRYKPEKRAVFRVDTRATNRSSGEKRAVCVFIRTYADDRGRAITTVMEALHDFAAKNSSITIPRPLIYLPERKTLVIEGLSGEQLLDGVVHDGAGAVVRAAGALAALHGFTAIPAPERSVLDLMGDALATGETLSHVLPDAQADIRHVLERLESLRPSDDKRAFVHGDFYHGQVLLRSTNEAVLDFDRCYLGDPIADVGNFCAHLHILGLRRTVEDPTALCRDFVMAYSRASGAAIERQHLSFWTAYGLFLLAVRPFRTLTPNWNQATADVLKLCRTMMQ